VAPDANGQDYAARRERLVAEVDAMYAETQRETGLARMSPAVREALGKVERHRFVPPGQSDLAYRNHPLPIGGGQTISQPYMVAAICAALALTGRERVLDVGTGSGYQAAVLAELAAEVDTIERIPELADLARARHAERERELVG
jgi:protein-L-isoaspartate(D-aspartate) O-methyltransferase